MASLGWNLRFQSPERILAPSKRNNETPTKPDMVVCFIDAFPVAKDFPDLSAGVFDGDQCLCCNKRATGSMGMGMREWKGELDCNRFI